MPGIHPDFFIVGAPKCGTTAMDRYLKSHPQIFVPEAKEIHHFGADLVMNRPRDDRAQYLSRFQESAGHQRAGEASVWYLFSQTAAQEIYDFNAAARIIIMLRDPVEVMYSQHSQAIYNGLGDEDIMDFSEALEAEEDRARGLRVPEVCSFPDGLRYREIVRFTAQVQRYLEVFPREQVHVIIYDDFKQDSEACCRELFRFLQVQEDVTLETPVINGNKVVRFPALRALQRRLPGGLKDQIPQRIRRPIQQTISRMNTQYTRRQPMDAALRRSLKEELSEEVSQLSDLLGRDLTHWSH